MCDTRKTFIECAMKMSDHVYTQTFAVLCMCCTNTATGEVTALALEESAVSIQTHKACLNMVMFM